MSASFRRGFAFVIFTSLTRSVDVPLAFYTSIDCEMTSTTTPNLALNLSICVVTPGLGSLHYDNVPCAGGGIVIPYLFKDTSCEMQQDFLDYYKTGSDFRCLSEFSSTSVVAIMLSCNKNNPEQPLATSTITVGPVATGPSGSLSSTSGTLSSSGTAGQSDDDRDTFGWHSLSLGARIGIIVAGVVVFVLALAYLVRRFRGDLIPQRNEPSQPSYVCQPSQLWDQSAAVTPVPPYMQVLDNTVRTARQRGALGWFLADNFGSGIMYAVNALPRPIVSATFTEHDPQWKHKLGAAGELYIFERLRALGLPNFGLHNWTSSLRALIAAYPGYHNIGASEDGIADFEYYDETGVLTEYLLLHGFSARGIKRHMRPIYYFEVKATTSLDPRTPFHISANQERHIRNALITPSQTNHVYIICSITGLGSGSSMNLRIFLDPEAMRKKGRLFFTPGTGEGGSSWTVRPA